MAKNVFPDLGPESYGDMSLEQLQLENQRLDREIQALREEKRTVSRLMDRRIHAQYAQARWNSMSMEERMAMRDLAQGA